MQKLTRSFITGLLLIIAGLALNGCGLKPVAYSATKTYTLNPAIPTITAKSGQLTLLVDTPKASQAFADTQMAYIDKPYQLAYFSYHEWAATPAQMLQPLLMQTIQNTGHFQAVITNANQARYDLVLNTRILNMQQVFLQKPSQFQLSIQAQLINNDSHRVIATQQFTIIEPAPTDSPYGGVIAANQATGKILQQLTHFCLMNTRQIKSA